MNAQDLFRLVARARHRRGWGRGLRSAVAGWYCNRPVADVAADILKCPEHNGWTHRDLLRLAHPKPGTAARNALFQWAATGELGHLATDELIGGELRQVYAVERLKKTGEEREALRLIEEYCLTHEMLPESWRRSSAVWECLLPDLSFAALVANLRAIADSGLLGEESAASALVVARLIDRRRALNSGLSSEDVARAREAYAAHPRAIRVVVDALDFAEEILRD